MSKIGKININVPEKTKIAIVGKALNIEGPLGKKTLTIDTEVFDSDSKYDTSNGRFTPGTAGKYLLYGSVQILGTSTADSNENIVKLYKNGSQHMVTYWITAIPQGVISWTATVDFNTTDYMEIYAKINNSSGDRKIVGAAANQKYTWFGGHKLIT